MSELPGRPDLDQLRRQARELLRAASGGEPDALARLRAVSERVTLSAAQLAVAREYGFPSWPALRAEAERRRRLSESRASVDPLVDRWSFGGATPIETTAGALSAGLLIIGPGHAALDASLMPEQTQRLPAAPPRPGESTQETRPTFSRAARRLGQELLRAVRVKAAAAAAHTATALAQSVIGDVTVTDDRGTKYGLDLEGMSGPYEGPGQAREPASLSLRLDPVPARACRWIELRSQDGSATRLLPSVRPAVRVGQLAPAAGSPAEREVSEHALWVIGLQLSGIGQVAGGEDILRRRCSAALARTAEIRQSGELDTASELPDQLARLCASLTGQHPASSLPPAWSGMLSAAQQADGPRHHLDLAAALPPVDDTAVQLDSLISEPESWQVYLRARPGWWAYSEDRHRKWAAMSVHAEDNLGGMYLSNFGGSTSHDDCDELILRFLPRLDPLAGALKLTFTGTGEQVAVELLRLA
jgi:hypothetical protein